MQNIILTIKKSFLSLPTPVNISYWWNAGSTIGLFLMIQILSGLILTCHYCPNSNYAFYSLIHIIQNVPNGWLIHNIHMNGASMFFIMLYIHISRGIYFNSFKLYYTWMIGMTLFLLSMITAFLGYVLPWGQMSFWGATVITNLMSTIPLLGDYLVKWVWGGFTINNATLTRFFTLHFITPFLIFMIMLIHIMSLHNSGSTNPLGLNSNMFKIPFHMYFTLKDLLYFMLLMMMFFIIIIQYPYLLLDVDNFNKANPMNTPIHIQPEWYFLYAYAILRSIPNKLGGVIALILSIMILFTLPFMKFSYFPSFSMSPLNQILFWMLINNFIILTWLGAQSIEAPFTLLSQIFSISYFMLFAMIIPTSKFWMNFIYS